MKKHIISVLLVLCLLAGVGLLLYPKFNNLLYQRHRSTLLKDYHQIIEQMDDNTQKMILDAARDYNQRLANTRFTFWPDNERTAEYESLLRSDESNGLDTMAFLRYECIGITEEKELPIYHGNSAEVLQTGLGHEPYSALPVGGEGTHCILCGHSGLDNGKIILDNLVNASLGDLFQLYVFGEVLTYQVDNISVVLPDGEEIKDLLMPTPGKDYCSMFTCTNADGNQHRFVVRGHRVENPEESQDNTIVVRKTPGATEVERMFVASAAAIPMLLVLFLVLMFSGRRKAAQKRAVTLERLEALSKTHGHDLEEDQKGDLS